MNLIDTSLKVASSPVQLNSLSHIQDLCKVAEKSELGRAWAEARPGYLHEKVCIDDVYHSVSPYHVHIIIVCGLDYPCWTLATYKQEYCTPCRLL